MSTLHDFGLQGARKATFFEAHPDALRLALERQRYLDQVLRNAPNLRAFLRSDPDDNNAQNQARTELQGILAAAWELEAGHG